MSESGITESESKRIHERLPAVSRYFRLKSQIGSGTFSKVYLAEIKGLQESPTVAIKIITPTSDPARVYSHGIYILNYLKYLLLLQRKLPQTCIQIQWIIFLILQIFLKTFKHIWKILLKWWWALVFYFDQNYDWWFSD